MTALKINRGVFKRNTQWGRNKALTPLIVSVNYSSANNSHGTIVAGDEVNN